MEATVDAMLNSLSSHDDEVETGCEDVDVETSCNAANNGDAETEADLEGSVG